MKLGYSTWGMPDVPIDVIVPHLSALGFDAIEICVLPRFSTALSTLEDGERRRIAELLRQHGLTLSAVNYYVAMLEQDEATYAHNLCQIKGAIDLAVGWTQNSTPPVVITGVGGRPGDLARQEAQLIDRVGELGDYAHARGVTIALEPHIGAAIETPDQTVDFIKKVTSPAVRINFDISHYNILGIPIEESVEKVLPYSAHTHIKDERGRAPDYAYLVPGEGDFDYVTYLRSMHGHGYQGVISVEISTMVQRRTDYDPLATATRSYQVVSHAFTEAGIERTSSRTSTE